MIFSDPTNRTGLVELLEDFTNTQSDIANSTSYSLARKTRDINNAYAHYIRLALKSAGKFQVDDGNQTNLQITTLNLVSGQNTYEVKQDSLSNQIYELLQVRIKDKNNLWVEIKQIDRLEFDINSYQNISGIPAYYDIIGGRIILYATPDYNVTDGIELFINRSPVYFTTTDTTKKPGIPDFFHEYLVLRPAYFWCLINLPDRAVAYERAMVKLESEITSYYSDRNKNTQNRITTEIINSI